MKHIRLMFALLFCTNISFLWSMENPNDDDVAMSESKDSAMAQELKEDSAMVQELKEKLLQDKNIDYIKHILLQGQRDKGSHLYNIPGDLVGHISDYENFNARKKIDITSWLSNLLINDQSIKQIVHHSDWIINKIKLYDDYLLYTLNKDANNFYVYNVKNKRLSTIPIFYNVQHDKTHLNYSPYFYNGMSNIYRLGTDNLETFILADKNRSRIKFSPDKRYMTQVPLSDSKEIILYDLIQDLVNNPIAVISFFGGAQGDVVFSPDSRYLVVRSSAEYDMIYDMINVYDLTQDNWVNNPISIMGDFKNDLSRNVVFSPNSQHLVVRSPNSLKEFYVYDVTQDNWGNKPIGIGESFDGNLRDEIKQKQQISNVSFSPDSRYLVVAKHWFRNNRAYVYDLTQDNWVNNPIILSNMGRIIFSPDSKYLGVFILDAQGRCDVYDLTQDNWVNNPIILSNVDRIAFSPDSRYLGVSKGSNEEKFDVYDLTKDNWVNNPISVMGRGFTFSLDSKYLFYHIVDGSMYMLNLMKNQWWRYDGIEIINVNFYRTFNISENQEEPKPMYVDGNLYIVSNNYRNIYKIELDKLERILQGINQEQYNLIEHLYDKKDESDKTVLTPEERRLFATLPEPLQKKLKPKVLFRRSSKKRTALDLDQETEQSAKKRKID